MAERAQRFGWWYMAEYSLRQARAYAWSILLMGIGQPLLYLVAIGVGLGGLLDTKGTTIEGASYLVFVAPALLISTIVMSVAGEVTYPVMAGFKWKYTYWAPAASPLSPRQVAWGHLLSVAIRFALQALVFWIFLLIFRAAPSATSILVVPIGVLTAMAVGAPLQAYAASLKDDGAAFVTIQRFVIMPMFLFAGTFFALDSMPLAVRWIGWISPIWHGTQLARWATFGLREPGWLVAVHLTFLVALTAIGLWFSARIYRQRLAR